MGREIGLIILLALSAGLPGEISAISEGGPSTFGYDASSACSKPYSSRVGRARLDNLPCDFRRENWCTIAGNSYPWQAVRRFVQENQGLMRRMYGDEKHISVLKTELEKNDVELELEDEHNHLYSEDASTIFRNFQFDVDYEFDQVRPDDDEQTQRNGNYRGRSLNSGSSSKFDKPKSPEDAMARHRSHPNETPIASTTAYSTSFTSTTVTKSSSPSTTSSPTSSKTASSTTSKDTPVTPTSTTPVVSLAQIAKIQNLSINEIPGQIDRFDADVDDLTEIPEALEGLLETTLRAQEDGEEEYSTAQFVSTSSERTNESYGDKEDQDAEDSEPQQQFRPRPEYRPPDANRPESAGSMEGQLFQDVAAKDKQEPPVLKVRGINACPVKEEVVAPFWANNTRGEVLALLNLYPFEQYVHWEKCTHENKQMYCRDGCRCEQQYRLHRLLAYDPNNECRGIFSDWFKFPSCCICRCYDLPVEFRVTSRSPRVVQRQKIKVRAPRRPPRQRYN